MVTQITHKHYCNIGALCNPRCFSVYDSKTRRLRYYYAGILSQACWMGWNHSSPGEKKA